MKKKTTFITVLLLLSCMRTLLATNYYLSASGSDNNTGTSSGSAWKTIEKLNTQMSKLAPGDVVYLRRGDVFEGQINLPVSGTSGATITIAAYGSGSKPVIKGSTQVTGWTQSSTNIWRAKVNATSVSQIFDNAKRLPNGRQPNTGFFRVESSGSNISFTDSKLSKVENFYVGANAVLQNSDFHWESKPVSSSTSAGRITFSSAMRYNIESGMGYFLNNKLEFVDSENEWFFDEKTQYLYLYAQADPSSRKIFATIFDYGIKASWNQNHVTISNLNFADQSLDAIWLRGAGCNNNTINDCDFINQRQNAISLMGEVLNIKNNSFTDIGGIAIEISNADKTQIENNSFKRIGLHPGLTSGGIGDLQAIRIWDSSNSGIIANTIDSTGYNGMTFNTKTGLVKNNIVTNTLINSSDGGALYCWSANANNITIQNNIVENVFGNVEARAPGKRIFKGSVYLDNGVHHCNVIDNTLLSTGIYTNAGTNNNNFYGNTVYESEFGMKASDWYEGASVNNVKMRRNVFYTNTKEGIPLLLQSNDNNYGMFTEADSNYYCNPYNKNVVRYDWSKPNSYTLREWKALSGLDKASKESYSTWTYPTDSSFIIVNKTSTPKEYNFSGDIRDLNNKAVTKIVLPAYSGKVLIKINPNIDGNEEEEEEEEENNDTGNNDTEEEEEEEETNDDEDTVGNDDNDDDFTFSNNLEVYPNPATSQIKLNCNDQITEIRIIDRFGATALHLIRKNIKVLDVSSLKPGLYHLFATTNKGNIEIVKLFIE